MTRWRVSALPPKVTAPPRRNFYYISELTTPEVLMPELIRLFMGRRIECAQCHNHPFEAWSQNQFWGLAAFFAGYTELRDSKLIIDVLGGGHVGPAQRHDGHQSAHEGEGCPRVSGRHEVAGKPVDRTRECGWRSGLPLILTSPKRR